MDEWGVDLLSLSAHKVYGPKGIGALFVRPRTAIEPIMTGGGQEGGLRPGTVPTPLVAGFGMACELADMEGAADMQRISELTRQLFTELTNACLDMHLFGHSKNRIPGNLCVGFPGMSAGSVVQSLADVVSISTGSACASATAEPSRVLLALGLEPEVAATGVRISLGRFTTGREYRSRGQYHLGVGPDLCLLDSTFVSARAVRRASPPLVSLPFDDLRPTAVVRELIQNSLDGAVAAGEPTAIVRFRLTTCDVQDVPGIDAYRRAFKRAIASQTGSGALPSKANRVVTTIRRALTQDKLKVLSVLDNGIGLDERRMTALLSDGVSAKGRRVRRGHTGTATAWRFPPPICGTPSTGASRLAENGSGQAMQSWRPTQAITTNTPASGDGFLVRGFYNGRAGTLFDYARGDSIPPLIRRELDDIGPWGGVRPRHRGDSSRVQTPSGKTGVHWGIWCWRQPLVTSLSPSKKGASKSGSKTRKTGGRK